MSLVLNHKKIFFFASIEFLWNEEGKWGNQTANMELLERRDQFGGKNDRTLTTIVDQGDAR